MKTSMALMIGFVQVTSALACTSTNDSKDENGDKGGSAADAGSASAAETGTTTDASVAPTGYTCTAGKEAQKAGWNLVWCDEFEGTAIDRTKWSFDLADGAFLPSGPGWGNQEKEFYTERSENARIEEGKLVLSALKDGPHHANGPGYASTYDYSSARMHTKNKADFVYGRFEIRAKVPQGQGLWPAFWMLPTDSEYGGWPSSGELDIMELRGQTPTTALGTLHYGKMWNKNSYVSCGYVAPTSLSDALHTYAVEWAATGIVWSVDDLVFATQAPKGAPKPTNTCQDAKGQKTTPDTNAQVTDPAEGWYSAAADSPAPFDRKFHILLNLAVGGEFVGGTVDPAVFPQRFEIDYVRVYQK